MAMNIKDTPYFALYGEIYRLHGKYLEPVADDSFWSDITGRTEKKVTDQELTKIKQYLSKVRQDCIEHPEKYYKGNVTVSCNGLSEREDNK